MGVVTGGWRVVGRRFVVAAAAGSFFFFQCVPSVIRFSLLSLLCMFNLCKTMKRKLHNTQKVDNSKHKDDTKKQSGGTGFSSSLFSL